MECHDESGRAGWEARRSGKLFSAERDFSPPRVKARAVGPHERAAAFRDRNRGGGRIDEK